MAGVPEPKPGPNKDKSRTAVMETIEDASEPCLSVGMVADRVKFSRRTVHTRLKELEDEGQLTSAEIGGSNAYWISETDPETDGGLWIMGARGFRFLRNFAKRRL